MSDPHRITEQFIKHGINPVAARLALRTAKQLMIDDGANTTAGFHDFGVFYVHTSELRFVIRGEDVYRVDAHTSLKLRPPKEDPIKLDESPDVRVQFLLQNESGQPTWSWKSTSRAGRFEVVTPTGKAGDAYDFVRFPGNGPSTYVLCKNTVSDANCSATTGLEYDDVANEIVTLRFAHSLLAIHEHEDGSFAWGPRSIEWKAQVDDGTLELITDGVYGKEVTAWCRQRSIDLVDR